MQRMPAKWELGCLADLTHVDKKGAQSFHHTNCFMSLQTSKNLFSHSHRFTGEEYDGTLPIRINLRTGFWPQFRLQRLPAIPSSLQARRCSSGSRK